MDGVRLQRNHFTWTLLTVLVLWNSVMAKYPPDGVEQEFCRTKDDCAKGRSCNTSLALGGRSCNSEDSSCRCTSPSFVNCSSSSDCSFGERCFVVKSRYVDGQFCLTCRWQLFGDFYHIDSNPSSCEGVWLGGYTGDSCFINYRNCATGRTCSEFLEEGSVSQCSYTTQPCYCWPSNLAVCSSSSQCEDGERCAKTSEGVMACFSCGRVESDDTLQPVDMNGSCITPTPSVDPNRKNETVSKPPIYPFGGVSLEHCRTKENCADNRECISIGSTSDYTLCNDTLTNCHCRHSIRLECSSSVDCPQGERCFRMEDTDPSYAGQFCWSCRAELSDGESFVDTNPATCEGVWLGGYTGDICSSAYPSCRPGRECSEVLEDGSMDLCIFMTTACFCWPKDLQKCTSSSDCEHGEQCALSDRQQQACFSCHRVGNDQTFTAIDRNAVCVTPKPSASPSSVEEEGSTSDSTSSPSPSPSRSSPSPSRIARPTPISADPPCISTIHLASFPKEGLVYKQHTRTSVLCDHLNSCATPGHIVILHGRPMMMVTYCTKHSTCLKRSMFVNSPRMSRGLRVPSHTHGLEFTALSARYESSVEELLIRFIFLVGI